MSARQAARIVRPTVERLRELAERRPEIADHARLLEAVLPALWTSVGSVTPSVSHDALPSSMCVDGSRRVEIKRRPLWRRWRKVCAEVARYQTGGTATDLQQKTVDEPELFDALIAAAVSGSLDEVVERANNTPYDVPLALMVLRWVLFPEFVELARVAEHRIESDAGGRCPVCGAWPLFAELRGMDQDRILRCGSCATSWPAPRMLCTFCRSSDHSQLQHFILPERLDVTEDDAEASRFRLVACDACRRYSKTIVTLTTPSPPEVLYLDVATLHLDLFAADRGYRVP